MRNLIIADNPDIYRAGIRYYSGHLKAIAKTTDVNGKKELIAALSRSQDSIVVIDYTLSEFGSADELIILQERFPKSSWLLFSEMLSDEFLKRIIYSNPAFSIALKSCGENEITAALRCTEHRERFICNQITNQLLNPRKPEESITENPLTTTEIAILKEIGLGKTTKEIAQERNLSFHTITTHRKNIFRKLNVNNLHEATRYAIRAGIIDPAEYYI